MENITSRSQVPWMLKHYLRWAEIVVKKVFSLGNMNTNKRKTFYIQANYNNIRIDVLIKNLVIFLLESNNKDVDTLN